MKVVLFCGGLGTRLREYTGEIPKPMVKIGYRPILWHLMKYYAHFGHNDFVLCLGYKADVIKEFFLRYEEWISNDFTLSKGGKELTLENNDIEDWNITFVDTGLHANIGERLVAVRKYVEDEEMFLANYSDGLTDLDLNAMIAQFRASGQGRVASWPCHRRRASTSSTSTRGARRVAPHRSASRTCSSTPASSRSARRSSTTSSPVRSWSWRRSPASSRTASCTATSTTGSGAWTRSRSSSS